jgi:hypothetical protein
VAITVNFNGVPHSIPENRETRGTWGASLSSFLVSVGNNALSKAGGNFTLTGEINFGTNHGIIAPYIKSASANIASSGVIRLSNTDSISFRNDTNDGNLTLSISTNRLQFNSDNVVTSTSTDTLENKTIDGDDNTLSNVDIASLKADAPEENKVLVRANTTGEVVDAFISDVHIDANAAITYSKLDLNDSLQVSDIDATEVTGSGSVVLSDNAVLSEPEVSDFALFTEQVSDPTTPASGKRSIYTKDDGFYEIDDTGLVKKLGAGGGAGEVNAIAEGSTSIGWSTSGSGITIATTTTTTDLPLAGIITSAIKITPVSSTDYARYRFTMPAALKQRKLKIAWEQLPLSGYASGDLRLEIHSNPNSDYSGSFSKFNLSTDSSSVTAIPNATGRFQSTFDTDNSDYYELRIVRNAGTTALNIANVVVGPGIQPQGAIVGEWQSYTPTLSTGVFGVTNLNMARWRRVGSSMELVWRVSQTSAGTAGSGTYTFTIPSGHTIDTSVVIVTGTTVSTDLGRGRFLVGSDNRLASVGAFSTTQLFCELQGSTTTAVAWSSSNGSLSNATLRFWIHATIPIAEWAGSGTVNLGSNDIEYASVGGTWNANSSTTVYGPQGSALGGTLTAAREKTITWQTAVQPGERIQIWGSKDQVQWFPIIGCSLGSANDVVTNQLTATGGYGAGSGVTWRPGASANQTVIRFHQYISMASDDSPVTNWPSTEAFWCATKSRAGAAVGFGLAANGNSGLINYYNESSFTSTFTFNGSGGTTGAINISAIRVGKLVTVHVKEGPVVGTGTNSNTLASNTAIPAWARPGTTVTGATPEIRIGTGPTWSTNGLGRFRLGSDGIISIARDNQGSNWPNTTSGCGVNNGFSISYTVD